MRLIVRPLLILSAATLILVGCTRERPTPEPTATSAAQASAPTSAPAPAVEVVTGTQPTTGSAESNIAATNTPDPLTPTPDPAGTPTPQTPDIFQYVVQAGDTLATIAARFETDVDTLRSLNNLSSDNIAVGQPLYVPYREGINAPGLPTPTPGPYYYTIQPGDTLSGIGVRFGVDSISILEANRDTLLDPNNLIVGTTILIPGYTPGEETATADEDDDTASGTPGDPVYHTVQPGQGLLEISAIYGVPVAEIMAANGLTEQDILRIGQQLVIPGITARDVAAATGNIHTVQPGESLLSIALLYGVTVEELQEANELDNPDAIFIGQELIIPRQ